MKTPEVQWDICVQCGRHICSEADTNNVKLCLPVFLVTLLIAVGPYEAYIKAIVISCAHELIGICGLYVAF